MTGLDERRRHERASRDPHSAALWLVLESGDRLLASVRDSAAGGARVELIGDVPQLHPGQAVTLEPVRRSPAQGDGAKEGPATPSRAHIAWKDGPLLGLQFLDAAAR